MKQGGDRVGSEAWRASFSAALAVVTALLVHIATVRAQEFPSTHVTLHMPYAAGGPGDTITRVLAQGLSVPLKQQVLVENVAGAAGTIGSARVAAAPPDGHTLLVMHIGAATNAALYPKLKYNHITDFEPIGLIAEVPMVLS